MLPNSDFEIIEDAVLFRINNKEYPIKLNIQEFDVGEGNDSFIETVINEILKKEKSTYFFYELPSDDEATSLIFVKPEVYKEALEKGAIPDSIGYFARNY